MLYKVTVWNGTRLVAVAENIAACGDGDARDKGLKALASRTVAKPEVKALYKARFLPYYAEPCETEGLQVRVHEEPGKIVK